MYMFASLSGCAKEAAGPVEEETSEPGVIDYLTGAEHIKQYKKMKSKLEDINKSRQEQYDDF